MQDDFQYTVNEYFSYIPTGQRKKMHLGLIICLCVPMINWWTSAFYLKRAGIDEKKYTEIK